MTDERQDQYEQHEATEDLDVDRDEAEAVKGGKVKMQDFSFTKKIDKTSPTL